MATREEASFEDLLRRLARVEFLAAIAFARAEASFDESTRRSIRNYFRDHYNVKRSLYDELHLRDKDLSNFLNRVAIRSDAGIDRFNSEIDEIRRNQERQAGEIS